MMNPDSGLFWGTPCRLWWTDGSVGRLAAPGSGKLLASFITHLLCVYIFKKIFSYICHYASEFFFILMLLTQTLKLFK